MAKPGIAGPGSLVPSQYVHVSRIQREICAASGSLPVPGIGTTRSGRGTELAGDPATANSPAADHGTAVGRSVCAGGRYDKMIGSFLGKGKYPAVGISFGLDRIYDAYVEKIKTKQKSVTEIYIIPINTFKESLKIAEELRNENVKVDIDLAGKGPSKNLQYANSMGIPYVLFVGEDELKQNKVKLKDMKSGKEQLMSADELVLFLQKI